MTVVLDTSVALAWCLPDENSPQADLVLDRLIETGEAILVPGLWVQETANAVVSAVRRRRITEAQAQRCVEALASLPVELDTHPADQGALVGAAMRHRLTAYEATYLLLAERSGAALATFDARLMAAAQAAGVTLLP